jgi:hypothetical protein
MASILAYVPTTPKKLYLDPEVTGNNVDTVEAANTLTGLSLFPYTVYSILELHTGDVEVFGVLINTIYPSHRVPAAHKLLAGSVFTIVSRSPKLVIAVKPTEFAKALSVAFCFNSNSLKT